ncbi:hypothetical protein HMN09_01301000 [Mycena chlorophos]|uniref:DUF6534 domain-containing protein n=1 Tax=Mycena chlorophos TaxID=658473 RepID=A0A8H6VQX9_MYCCL|nr:hypothetical protein HMN09_01301000 [Mycena chlorophos]
MNTGGVLGASEANSTLGALLIGTLAGCVLYGVSTVQVYLYYKRFPDDHWILRYFVLFIWLMEGAHVGAIANTLYIVCITDYVHPERLLGRPPPSTIGLFLITVTIAVGVQLFFSYRIWILSQSRIIPCLMTLISVVRFALGTSLFAIGINIPTLDEFGTKWRWLGISMWGLSAVEDLTITASLVFLLARHRKHVHRATTAFLDKIIMWSIELAETGMLTASFSLTTLILYRTMPNNEIWIGFSILEARMFANSFYASLNSRTVLRDMQGSSHNLNLSGFGNKTNQSVLFKPFSPATRSGC